MPTVSYIWRMYESIKPNLMVKKPIGRCVCQPTKYIFVCEIKFDCSHYSNRCNNRHFKVIFWVKKPFSPCNEAASALQE